MTTNRFKLSSQKRTGATDAAFAIPRDTRRALDDYETPSSATLALCEFVDLGPKPKIFEPAAGSGRMVRALQAGYYGAKITTADIKNGEDFLARDDSRTFAGAIITNPPYGKLADPFIRKALAVADGKVAMLMQSGFLFGSKRALALYARQKPELIILISWRIFFIEGDDSEKPINSQTYTHAWIVWSERGKRNSNRETRVEWASQYGTIQPWH